MRRLCLMLGVVLICIFLAACDEDRSDTAAAAPAEPAATVDPDSPRATFDSYRAAMRDGDLEALKGVLAAEARAGLEKADAEMAIGMIQSLLPDAETVTGIEENGDTATLRLTSENEGKEVNGKVALVREDGLWKVAKENWNLSGGSVRDEPEVADIPDREPDGDWRLDCDKAKITDAPAAGRIGGKPFTVRYARIQNAILTLTDGDNFRFDGQFLVFLFFRGDDKNLNGRVIEIGPEKDWKAKVSAHVHYNYEVEGADNVMEAKTEGFALRIEFGQEADGKLPGRIYLSYPDEKKSYVVGSFTAIVE